MVMTSLYKAIVAPEAGSMRRKENRAAAVQVVMRTPKMFWVTKAVIIRNVPVTAVRPTPRLAAWRYFFAEAASAWKGATGVGTLKQDSRSGKHKAGDTVLKVHEVAQETLKAKYKEVEGRLPARSATYDPSTGRYRTYINYRVHSPEELRRLAGMA